MIPLAYEDQICALKVHAQLSWTEIENMTLAQGRMLLSYIERQQERAAQYGR